MVFYLSGPCQPGHRRAFHLVAHTLLWDDFCWLAGRPRSILIDGKATQPNTPSIKHFQMVSPHALPKFLLREPLCGRRTPNVFENRAWANIGTGSAKPIMVCCCAAAPPALEPFIELARASPRAGSCCETKLLLLFMLQCRPSFKTDFAFERWLSRLTV